MKFAKSQELFEIAKTILPGGVNSPVRAFNAVGGNPLFIERGEGVYLFDVDGNRYIDYVQSWGPLILGHAHPKVVKALVNAIEKGTSYGAPSELEIRLGAMIQEFMPNIEMIRFVNSGTEAVMSAIRLARAYTSRNKIIKFQGCYHGHADLLLVQAGSGVSTLGLPDSPGVPSATVQDTLVAKYNDLSTVEALFKLYPDEISAVIVEPVAGNMGVIPPVKGFLHGLRTITNHYESLLIFDEVMTGFRVNLGGAQTLYGIEPDLTTLGKVIGGGLPVGAYGGKRAIMEMVAPVGPVYQAGTLSGNPLAMTAGLETLRILRDGFNWKEIIVRAQVLVEGIDQILKNAGIASRTTQVGTMFSVFFTNESIDNWDSVITCDTDLFRKYFWNLIGEQIYIAPSQFEAGFVSALHDDQVIQETLSAVERAVSSLE